LACCTVARRRLSRTKVELTGTSRFSRRIAGHMGIPSGLSHLMLTWIRARSATGNIVLQKGRRRPNRTSRIKSPHSVIPSQYQYVCVDVCMSALFTSSHAINMKEILTRVLTYLLLMKWGTYWNAELIQS
jgi:hypothetical protein